MAEDDKIRYDNSERVAQEQEFESDFEDQSNPVTEPDTDMQDDSSFSDDSDAKEVSRGGRKFSWGILVLVAGAIWAVYELVKAVMYFFS